MEVKGKEVLMSIGKLKHEVGKTYRACDDDSIYIVIENFDFCKNGFAMVDLETGSVDTRVYETLEELDEENGTDILLNCYIQVVK